MVLKLRLAGDLPPAGEVEFIVGRILAQDEPLSRGVWIWTDTREAGHLILEQLVDALGDSATRYTKSTHQISLAKGGRIVGMIPRARPDGERQIAIWAATSEIPHGYLSRLLHLGQCEEFWGRPGTVPLWTDGSDWRKGTPTP